MTSTLRLPSTSGAVGVARRWRKQCLSWLFFPVQPDWPEGEVAENRFPAEREAVEELACAEAVDEKPGDSLPNRISKNPGRVKSPLSKSVKGNLTHLGQLKKDSASMPLHRPDWREDIHKEGILSQQDKKPKSCEDLAGQEL